ncbi:class I SAM-dependent methyltransferase [bacterium]|nr:class I SAM-dependent methyltransferase [bacterium]
MKQTKKQILALTSLAVLAGLTQVIKPELSSQALACLLLASLGVTLLSARALKAQSEDTRREIAAIPNQTQRYVASELHSMQCLMTRFPDCSIPTTSWSMSFMSVHSIIEMMDQHKPKFVVEFGSGLSTLCIASWLREQGSGRLLSFDHDLDWASITRRHLLQAKLETYAKVVHAPLSGAPQKTSSTAWYDIPPDSLGNEEIDMVIIDGPPAGTRDKRLARLPSLPVLHDHLSSSAVLFLDDANRPGECEVVEYWLEQYPSFSSSTMGGTTGLACLVRQG